MNRRDFLTASSMATMGLSMALGAEELSAQGAAKAASDKPSGPPVPVAVIGLGAQGRKMLESLAKLGNAPTMLCDTFSAETFVKKAQAMAPDAKFVSDYRQVLDDKTVQGVLIATPTHKHKQIVLDALQAGKHVYCEAPLSNTIEEARVIAKAGIDAKPIFMPGIQVRSNKQNLHVMKFVRAGNLGTPASARAQWHSKNSWRAAWPTEERARELDWRLDENVSTGLLGEIGIHQIDMVTWYLDAQAKKGKDAPSLLPTAISGFGGVMFYQDGRKVADTVQCRVEYPGGLNLMYDATLVNSFEGAYEVIQGSEMAIILRDQRAWMVKEVDSKLLGWEVYARKDDFSVGDAAAGSGIKNATGIALVADATKQLALGKQPGQIGTDVSKTALYSALETFTDCIRNNKKPDVTALDGFRATAIALKANEAVTKGTRIVLEKEWLEI